MRSKLKSSEIVKATFRQHLIVLWKPILFLLLVILLIIIMAILIDNFIFKYVRYSIIILLIFIIFFGIKLLECRYRLWIVTNMRVIYEWGVLSVNIKESPHEKINSISFHQSFVGRILNFGDVVIQTAAELGDIKFDKIAYPQRFANTLSEMREKKVSKTN